MSNKKLEVSQEFVLAAHKAACIDWKRKIEGQFPTLFAKNAPIDRLLDSFGRKVYGSFEAVASECGYYIVIPLPNANTDWTFAAFKYAKELIDKYEDCYIVHRGGICPIPEVWPGKGNHHENFLCVFVSERVSDKWKF
jgi:hypothetical protein